MPFLKTDSNRSIPPCGPKTAKIAYIGEAPGAEEAAQGIPFVGRSGQLLRQLSIRSHVIPEQCYLSNVVKERPPNNDIGTFIKFGKGSPEETPKFAEYKRILYDEVNSLSANVIIAVGRVAMYALTGVYEQINKYRGSVLRGVPEIGGRKVIPIIHPSAAIRGEFNYRLFICEDIKRARMESEYPEIRLKDRTLITMPKFDQVMAFLKECREAGTIGIDIETSTVTLEVICLAISISDQMAMCIPFRFQGDDYFTLEDEVAIMTELTSILEDHTICKIAHNANFDFPYLFNRYGIWARNIECTLIEHKTYLPAFPASLAFVVSVYTDMPFYKDDGKDKGEGAWASMSGPNENFFLYNARDAVVLPEIYDKLQHDLKVISGWEGYKRQVALLQPLMYMQQMGIRVDTDGLKLAANNCATKLIELNALLQEQVGHSINPASPKQLAQYFYEEKGLPAYYKGQGDKRTVTTNETAMSRIARKGFKEAQTIIDIRELAKRKSTYFEIPINADGRLRCNLNPAGTTSGRFSSSANLLGEGANMQNLPAEMKPYLLADPGHLVFEFDLSQAENRITAYIAPEPKMIRAFEDGDDVHKLTASMIFKKPVSEVTTKRGTCSIGSGRESERFWGKKANHSLNYGMGYKAFSLQNQLPEREGKFIVDSYHYMYPGIRSYHQWIVQEIMNTRLLRNCLGRTIMFTGPTASDKTQREAFSFIPQSTCAEIINQWGLLYIYENQDLFAPVKLLNQVHDSIWFEIPIRAGLSRIANMLQLIKNNLEQEIVWKGRKFIIPCDLKVGYNMLHMLPVEFPETYDDDEESDPAEEIADELADIDRRCSLLRDLNLNRLNEGLEPLDFDKAKI